MKSTLHGNSLFSEDKGFHIFVAEPSRITDTSYEAIINSR